MVGAVVDGKRRALDTARGNFGVVVVVMGLVDTAVNRSTLLNVREDMGEKKETIMATMGSRTALIF
jgi:hypothetical protein